MSILSKFNLHDQLTTTNISKDEKFKMIAENVTVSYGDIPAVKNVTMKFKEKSVVVEKLHSLDVLIECMI